MNGTLKSLSAGPSRMLLRERAEARLEGARRRARVAARATRRLVAAAAGAAATLGALTVLAVGLGLVAVAVEAVASWLR
jgi:hypothetical protein